MILCLTETQQKVDSVNFSKGIQYETSMRSNDDKKGGGLMILYHESNDVTTVKKYTDTHSDVLVVKLKVYDKYLMIVLVYMSVNDMEKNKEIILILILIDNWQDSRLSITPMFHSD